MTFEQFQATRKWSDNLAVDVSSENWEGCEGTPQGNLYLDCLYIDQVQPWWPEAAQKEGKWHLLLNNEEWISNNLTTLERRLYDWAASEGYFEDKDAMIETERRLCEDFHRWTQAQGLPAMSADELLAEDITREQRLWLSSFIAAWEAEMTRQKRTS